VWLVAEGFLQQVDSTGRIITGPPAATLCRTDQGLTVILDALPVDGRIVLLERDGGDDARLAREAAKRAARSGHAS
jgi:hypothetical protein